MWFFRKKKTIENCGLLKGFTDFHSHILPGVDDGIKTMEMSLSVLSRYEELGIQEVWLTPHIMEDYPNTTFFLRERFEELKEQYQGNITLHLAAENMLDSLFEERLEADDLLTIGMEGKRILVETSYFNPPLGLFDLLEQIKQKGYTPILAHPERYYYMDIRDYVKLKEMNIQFQQNITSLVGAYGKDVKKKAEMIQNKGWVNYLGTDLHRLDSFNKLIQVGY